MKELFEAYEFITRYISPKGEASVAKDIPISELESARKYLDVISKFEGSKFRCVYRGKRSGYGRSYTLKNNAKSFAVYVKSLDKRNSVR